MCIYEYKNYLQIMDGNIFKGENKRQRYDRGKKRPNRLKDRTVTATETESLLLIVNKAPLMLCSF